MSKNANTSGYLSTNPVPKHHMEIGIKKPYPSQVLAARKVKLRDRFLNAIFGKGHSMVVLVPGESVGTISITEMEVRESDEPLEGHGLAAVKNRKGVLKNGQD